MSLPGIIVFGLPPLLLAALSFAFRRRGLGTHVLIWLVGLPVLFVLTAVLTALISFQVFGLDLID